MGYADYFLPERLEHAETLFFPDLNALNDWNGLNQQHLAFG